MNHAEEFCHLFRITFDYTVPITFINDKGNWSIGTGVVVQIGERVFIATAAHCMPSSAAIMNEKGFSLPPPAKRTTIVKTGGDWNIDIGFLELKVDEDFNALGKSRCTLEQISTTVFPQGAELQIVGFPEGATEINNQQRLVVIMKRGFRVPFLGKREKYYTFPFARKEAWFHLDNGTISQVDFVETPHGFSGGGLWGFNKIPEDELFVPDKHIKLTGIQCEWDKDDRTIKCVPIERWLELIYRDYDDLRQKLVDKFPSLATQH